ncbi:MAG: DUF1190 domain-containing protein, partial [Hyphomicrobium sp.]
APKATGASKEQLVFTSAADCAATGMIKQPQCAQAIEAAMAQHLAGSPVYRNRPLCEAKEGPENCERMDEKAWRPRLSAVAASVAAAADAEASGAQLAGTPLYPTIAGEHGFRTLGNAMMLIDGDLLTFSPQAVAAAEVNASLAKN